MADETPSRPAGRARRDTWRDPQRVALAPHVELTQGVDLSERQRLVLRAVVAAYVAEAAPASSARESQLLWRQPPRASRRNRMGGLAALGLIGKPPASAGRGPTERGLRQFLDRLIDPAQLVEYERRLLQSFFDEADTASVMQLASQLLSERTHQLGFVMLPYVERIRLRHVSLVRLARDRVLVVLVPEVGPVQQRVIEERGSGDQLELDRIAAELNRRAAGRTLRELQSVLEGERAKLRQSANRLLARSFALGLRLIGASADGGGDLVFASRLALLSQPEFDDPERIRELLAAVETHERLIEVLGCLLEQPDDGVSVSLGEELAASGLRQCALVAVPYGGVVAEAAGRPASARSGAGRAAPAARPLGVLGVIGPARMDYARVIPLVSYCSQLVTEKLVG